MTTNTLAKCATLAAIAFGVACSGDELHSIHEPAVTQTPECDDGTLAAADGTCPMDAEPEPEPEPVVPTGTITGRLCDPARGIWVANITVSVTTDDGTTLSDTTDFDGSYTLEEVPTGNYYVTFSGTDYENVETAVVTENETTDLGVDACVAPPGHLKGAVCDERTGYWVEGATVTLDDEAGSSATTDTFGRFIFLSIPAGEYELTITLPDGTPEMRAGTVVSGEITDIGPSRCVGATGSATGRICGTDGYWLAGASVAVDLGGGAIASTTTDGDGWFSLSGLPTGTHTVVVTKGSFTTSFEIDIVDGQSTVLPDPVCIPPTVQMAVVTGLFDAVEDVLTDLGYVVRDQYDTRTPVTQDPSGTVDIIAGEKKSFWLEEFLTDPVWMADYEIIFLNCGLDDTLLAEGTYPEEALQNLRNFVDEGGSVYASDWAGDTIRMAFPGRIRFYGGNDFGGSRVGRANTALPSTIVDQSLASSLGTTAVTLNLNLVNWEVLETRSSQPSGLRVLVLADVEHRVDPFGLFTSTMRSSPLVVRFDYGRGRVLFTSVHNEGQNTSDLEDILNYVVFEL